MGHAAVSGAQAVCGGCLGAFDPRELDTALYVCPACGHHLPLSPAARLRHLLDPGTFHEWNAGMRAVDLLGFEDRETYSARLARNQRETGLADALVCGAGSIVGCPVGIGVLTFAFLGGSMGAVVGEKVTRLFARASVEGRSVVLVLASGGARVQEGPFALLQMAKTAVAVARFRTGRYPYLAVLTDPTTGGVAASIGMLGDVIIAEPGAMIGFAGPRVIEQTIRAPVPAGYQRAEALLARGQIDIVVPRPRLRSTLARLLAALAPRSSRLGRAS